MSTPSLGSSEVQKLNAIVKEIRDYRLNKDKAVKKKLENTKNEDFVITETDGGVRLKMNTGMYELFRHAADTFFRDSDFNCSVCKIPVFDKSGLLIETKYKLSKGRTSLYTANFYHTAYSCLINELCAKGRFGRYTVECHGPIWADVNSAYEND